jgi:hypothetical protein
MPRRHTESFGIFIIRRTLLTKHLVPDCIPSATKLSHAASSFTLANQILVLNQNACTHVQFLTSGSYPTATSPRLSHQGLCRNNFVRCVVKSLSRTFAKRNQHRERGLLLLSSQWPFESNPKLQQEIMATRFAILQFDYARVRLRIHRLTVRGRGLSVPCTAMISQWCQCSSEQGPPIFTSTTQSNAYFLDRTSRIESPSDYLSLANKEWVWLAMLGAKNSPAPSAYRVLLSALQTTTFQISIVNMQTSTQGPSGAGDLCKAHIYTFGHEQQPDHTEVSVSTLLRDDYKVSSLENGIRWIHLPVNNMVWAEVLMTTS